MTTPTTPSTHLPRLIRPVPRTNCSTASVARVVEMRSNISKKSTSRFVRFCTTRAAHSLCILPHVLGCLTGQRRGRGERRGDRVSGSQRVSGGRCCSERRSLWRARSFRVSGEAFRMKRAAFRDGPTSPASISRNDRAVPLYPASDRGEIRRV
jgi:hypothetical protein